MEMYQSKETKLLYFAEIVSIYHLKQIAMVKCAYCNLWNKENTF